MHACMYVCLHAYVCMHVCMHMYVCICTHVLYIPVAPQEYRIRAVSFPHPEFAPVTMHVKPVKSTADTESVGEMKHLACRNSQTSVS